MVVLTVLTILTGFVIAALVMIHVFKDQSNYILFVIFLFLLLGLGMTIGICIKEKRGIESKSIIKPDMEIVCKNSKCDTTYIYKTK